MYRFRVASKKPSTATTAVVKAVKTVVDYIYAIEVPVLAASYPMETPVVCSMNFEQALRTLLLLSPGAPCRCAFTGAQMNTRGFIIERAAVVSLGILGRFPFERGNFVCCTRLMKYVKEQVPLPYMWIIGEYARDFVEFIKNRPEEEFPNSGPRSDALRLFAKIKGMYGSLCPLANRPELIDPWKETAGICQVSGIPMHTEPHVDIFEPVLINVEGQTKIVCRFVANSLHNFKCRSYLLTLATIKSRYLPVNVDTNELFLKEVVSPATNI